MRGTLRLVRANAWVARPSLPACLLLLLPRLAHSSLLALVVKPLRSVVANVSATTTRALRRTEYPFPCCSLLRLFVVVPRCLPACLRTYATHIPSLVAPFSGCCRRAAVSPRLPDATHMTAATKCTSALVCVSVLCGDCARLPPCDTRVLKRVIFS